MAVPFDNGPDALATCAVSKEKYAGLHRSLAVTGKDVQVLGFMVVVLGSWFPGNESAPICLGISQPYRRLMQRLCCIIAIKESWDIHIEHVRPLAVCLGSLIFILLFVINLSFGGCVCVHV